MLSEQTGLIHLKNVILSGYDNRVTKAGSSTTVYPSPSYRVEGTTSTVYLAGGDGNALAEIANVGTTSTISTLATDHLGSTALTANSSGTVNQLLDYHGYGNTRISSGSTTEKKTFIGQYSDTETSLSYLNARYYDAGRGQFLSEDPMFWGSLSPRSLLNPQRLNSYSYARDNPVKRKDPSGLYDINTGLIQKGDTLSAITSQINKAWGTTYTVSSLAAENGISNVNLIYAGSYIYYTMPGVMSSEDGVPMSSSSSESNVSVTSNSPVTTKSNSSISDALSKSYLEIIGALGSSGLPPDTNVVRWGPITAEEFLKGTGVTQAADGTLDGVSLRVGVNGQSVAELMQGAPARFGDEGGWSPIGELEEAGLDIVQKGADLTHWIGSRLTPEEFVEVFEEIE